MYAGPGVCLYSTKGVICNPTSCVCVIMMRVVAGGAATPAGTRRHELVVVASLIDKVPNLAGLARTAEVLGAGTLVLSNRRVTGDQVFTR